LAGIAEQTNPGLDRSRTAGTYIDQASGKLVVNVTEPGAAGELDQDKVTEQQVTNSLDTLDTARDTVATQARRPGRQQPGQ
jgi:hypothetical protein